MTTAAQLRAETEAKRVENRAASVVVLRYWPKSNTLPSHCRGTSEGACTSGAAMGRDGFCTACHKRVVTLARLGYAVHPIRTLWASYATYRAKTPQSAPKPNRQPPTAHVPAEAPMSTPMPRTFTDGDLGAFPTPEQARAKVPVVAPPEPAPMFGPGWAKAAIEGAASTDRPFGKRQALVDDGKEILAAPATPPPSTSPNLTDARATIDALRLEVATLKALLKNPDHLRAALARIDAKAAEIATLKARLAELESE